MVLSDTSMWIPYFNGEDSLDMKLKYQMIIEDKLCICPTILQEILQGTSTDIKYLKIRNTTDGLNRLECDAYKAAIGAAEIYRRLREKGVTIRKSNDCLIAWYALHYDIPLWYRDHDFDQISKYFPLRIFKDQNLAS